MDHYTLLAIIISACVVLALIIHCFPSYVGCLNILQEEEQECSSIDLIPTRSIDVVKEKNLEDLSSEKQINHNALSLNLYPKPTICANCIVHDTFTNDETSRVDHKTDYKITDNFKTAVRTNYGNSREYTIVEIHQENENSTDFIKHEEDAESKFEHQLYSIQDLDTVDGDAKTASDAELLPLVQNDQLIEELKEKLSIREENKLNNLFLQKIKVYEDSHEHNSLPSSDMSKILIDIVDKIAMNKWCSTESTVNHTSITTNEN